MPNCICIRYYDIFLNLSSGVHIFSFQCIIGNLIFYYYSGAILYSDSLGGEVVAVVLVIVFNGSI